MNGYLFHVADEIMLYVVLATGMNLAIGYGGQFNLAVGALFGFGAYSMAIALHAGWNFPAALLLAAILTALLGGLVGLPALRVRSHYLALVTLGFGESLDLVFTNATPLTGGSIGITGIPAASIGPWRFDNDLSFAVLALTVTAIGLVAARLFVSSRIGRNLRAVRDDAIAARACGIHVGAYQLGCFALSGLYAGVAGGLYAVWLNYISPATFDLSQSIFVLAQVLLGGAGTIIGPLIGAVALVSMHEALIALGDFQLLVYGVLIVVLVLVARGGIAGAFTRLIRHA